MPFYIARAAALSAQGGVHVIFLRISQCLNVRIESPSRHARKQAERGLSERQGSTRPFMSLPSRKPKRSPGLALPRRCHECAPGGVFRLPVASSALRSGRLGIFSSISPCTSKRHRGSIAQTDDVRIARWAGRYCGVVSDGCCRALRNPIVARRPPPVTSLRTHGFVARAPCTRLRVNCLLDHLRSLWSTGG